MGNRKPQDKDREDALVKMFGLIPTNQNRIGIDAKDEHNNQYELKTTTKSSVSTARDVGMNHLKKWRSLFWICSKGHYENDDFCFEETYFLFPEDLEPWFLQIETKLTSKDLLFQRIIDLLCHNGFTQDEISQLEYVFQRGVLLNDPNIPWSYIKSHGRLISGEYATTLRQLLDETPRTHYVEPQLSLFDSEVQERTS
jgi:hypothetical protein